jgi:multiple sugar transport system permease protein
MIITKEKPVRVFRYLIVVILILWSAIPILWLVSTSFKTRLEIFSSPPRIIFKPNFDSYVNLLGTGAYSILPYLMNSVGIAVLSTLATLVLGALAAYAFSRMRFPGSRFLLSGVVLSKLLPPIVAIVPLFLLMRSLRLIDTHIGLAAIYAALNLPFAIWLLKAAFDAIPKALEEAALLDGCSSLGALRHVTFPLALPGIASAAIFVFIMSWREFTFALIFTSIRAKTMPVLIAESIGEMEISWQNMSTQATLVALPAFFFAYYMERYLIRGLTAGAIK